MKEFRQKTRRKYHLLARNRRANATERDPSIDRQWPKKKSLPSRKSWRLVLFMKWINPFDHGLLNPKSWIRLHWWNWRNQLGRNPVPNASALLSKKASRQKFTLLENLYMQWKPPHQVSMWRSRMGLRVSRRSSRDRVPSTFPFLLFKKKIREFLSD